MRYFQAQCWYTSKEYVTHTTVFFVLFLGLNSWIPTHKSYEYYWKFSRHCFQFWIYFLPLNNPETNFHISSRRNTACLRKHRRRCCSTANRPFLSHACCSHYSSVEPLKNMFIIMTICRSQSTQSCKMSIYISRVENNNISCIQIYET
jgi:hypothetical protein